MKYTIKYKSYDLNREKVLTYGLEEITLFELYVDVTPTITPTTERNEFLEKISNEDYFNSLTEEEQLSVIEQRDRVSAEDMMVLYSIYPHVKFNSENLISYINEKQIIKNNFENYRESIGVLENIDKHLRENFSEISPLSYEDFITFKVEVINFITDILENICNKHEWFYKFEDTTIQQAQDIINLYIEEVIKNSSETTEELQEIENDETIENIEENTIEN